MFRNQVNLKGMVIGGIDEKFNKKYIFQMLNVPLKDLRKNFSRWAEKASQGDIIQVTRYNRPYILLISGQKEGLIQGNRVGQETLSTVLRKGTGGHALRYLIEDREE